MSVLVNQRCFQHPAREAAVRCPECRRFYCRECATEHQGRMICAACLARLAERATVAGKFARTRWTLLAVGGLLLAWLIFFYAGMALARLPSEFHGGLR